MSASTVPAQRATYTPLIALIRSLLDQYGEITLRAVPAGHEHAATGYVLPHEWLVGIPDGLDDHQVLERLVGALYSLAVADMDPRLEESAARFVDDATRRTLAAMGEVAR